MQSIDFGRPRKASMGSCCLRMHRRCDKQRPSRRKGEARVSVLLSLRVQIPHVRSRYETASSLVTDQRRRSQAVQVQLHRRGWLSPGFVPAHLDEGLINIARCDAVSHVAYGAGVKCVPSERAQLVKPARAIQLDTMPRKWWRDALAFGTSAARQRGERSLRATPRAKLL